MRIIVLILIMLGLPQGVVMVFPDNTVTEQVERFFTMSLSEQKYYLGEIGCDENRIINPDVLKVIIDRLNSRYLPMEDYSQLSMDERLLIAELGYANACWAYMGGGGKDYHLKGCRIGYRLLGLVPPGEGIKAMAACRTQHPEYTEEERQEIMMLTIEGWEKIIKAPNMEADPRRNYYRFRYGTVLCHLNLDCRRGLQLMYEAALDEYREKGAEGFDEEIAFHLAPLNNAALHYKDPQKYRFVAELYIALNAVGHPKVGSPDYEYNEILTKWASEGVPGADKTKSLEELAKGEVVAEGEERESEPAPKPVQEPAMVVRPAPKEEPVVVTKPEAPPEPGRGLRELIRAYRIAVLIVVVVVVMVIIGVAVIVVRRR